MLPGKASKASGLQTGQASRQSQAFGSLNLASASMPRVVVAQHSISATFTIIMTQSTSASMSATPPLPGHAVRLPVPISRIAGQYLLFSADAAAYLRREHHICGVLSGTLPQVPQQNVFLGLPLQLMPEEARLLVDSLRLLEILLGYT
ncbi:tRNA-splicing endonuclease subunit [Ascosphaera acerosa]|nr:tRNA-splicing endonuclease subunit [Ascosphaera acerosa]